LLVAASSCGGDDDDEEEAEATPRRTTTSERETTTTTLDPEEVERQAVLAASEVAAEARRDSAAPPNPDPDLPALAETHTGAMLDQWVDATTILRLNGFAIRYPENSQYRRDVESVSFDEVDGQSVAYLEVCTVDDGERFSMVTGDIFVSGVRTGHATEAMLQEGDAWKLAERRENDEWEGVAGCAVQ
jgi:hypothetical protein